MSHTAFVSIESDSAIAAAGDATVTHPVAATNDSGSPATTFTLEVDRQGNGQWQKLQSVKVPANGHVAHILPSNLDATWLRFRTNQDVIATAFLHQTTRRFVDGSEPSNLSLFAGLADAGDAKVRGAHLYAAKRNRNLRIITDDDRYLEFTKAEFEFKVDVPDPKLKTLLEVKPDFTVDDASVVLQTGSKTLRLPKGDAVFDHPFATGWPRASREVESERHLANIHGTFYEVPLITNGAPPAWHQMRPVSSHSKQITDFCTWNGLLVLAGVRSDAHNDGHVFADAKAKAALWFGGIDDLWKLGKPVGQGGPWHQTEVHAGEASDAYLMTGYDRKSVVISQESAYVVSITLEVDINGDGFWVPYRRFDVPPNGQLEHEFPEAFSASWVRAVSDLNTTATVQFSYR